MHALVTGAAGYIGSHAAKALIQQQHHVLAIDTLELGHQPAIDAIQRWRAQQPSDTGSLTFHRASTHDRETLAHLIAQHNIEAVFHFAAYALVPESVAHPLKYHRNNAAGTIALLSACHDARQQHGTRLARTLVFSSTCATYGNVTEEQTPIAEDTPQHPTHAYGSSKLAAETAIREYAAAENAAQRPFAAAALRYFNVAGADPDGILGEDHDPETHLIPLAINAALGRRDALKVFGTDYDTPDGTAIRDYIHVSDLVQAHITLANAMQQPASTPTPLAEWNVYNLGSGNGHSVRQALDAVARVAGTPVPAQDAPRRPGDPPRLFADTSKFTRHFGSPPAMRTLDEQVATALAWFRDHPNGYRTV